MKNVIKMFKSKKAEKFVMVKYSSLKSGIKVLENSIAGTEEEVFSNVDTSSEISLFNIDLKDEWKEYCNFQEEEISFKDYIDVLNKNSSNSNKIQYKEGDFYYQCTDGNSYVLFQNEIDYNECLEMAGNVSHCSGSQPKYKIVPVSEIVENQHKYDVSEKFLVDNIQLEDEYFFPYVHNMDGCDDENMDIKIYKEDSKWIVEQQIYGEDAHLRTFLPTESYEWEVRELVKTLKYDI